MKILITHNDYGRHSGEEAAVDKMGQMMQSYGHQISYLRPSTSAHQEGILNKIRIFLAGIYSIKGITGMRKALRHERPDIINIHNLYPFISPAALFACRSAGIPVVMTVHNYRLVCPTGLFLRNGRPCEHCLHHRNEWGCIRYNCEMDVFKSMGYALRSFIARKTGAYHKNVDRFVCLTSFQKNKLVEAGFKADKIIVIPNSISLPKAHAHTTGEYIAYAGRLSEEKGWDLLLLAAAANPTLRFAVAGFFQNQHLARAIPDNIHFTGYLDQPGLTEFYRLAKFVVIPSRCYEGFPLVALEAMAMGKPVVAPNHGGFPDIIGTGPNAVGCLFHPGDVEDLQNTIVQLWNDPQRILHLGQRSLEKVRNSYSADLIYRQWENLFLDISQSPKN